MKTFYALDKHGIGHTVTGVDEHRWALQCGRVVQLTADLEAERISDQLPEHPCPACASCAHDLEAAARWLSEARALLAPRRR